MKEDCCKCKKWFHLECCIRMGWDTNADYKGKWICGNCSEAREGGMEEQKVIMQAAAAPAAAPADWVCSKCGEKALHWCTREGCERAKDGENPKPFPQKCNLASHIKKVHDKQGLAKCEMCKTEYFHAKDAERCEMRCGLNALNPPPRPPSSIRRASRRPGNGEGPSAASGLALLESAAATSSTPAAPAAEDACSDA